MVVIEAMNWWREMCCGGCAFTAGWLTRWEERFEQFDNDGNFRKDGDNLSMKVNLSFGFSYLIIGVKFYFT